MGIGDIFWIFLMISMVMPWIQQRVLERGRVKMMHRIERQRHSRVILMVHRQETMNLLGFPVLRYIDINDSEEVIRAIHLTDENLPLDLILHTPGGLVVASLQIARAIRARKAKVTVFVPHYAMSGGTLIALAATEIVMDEHAVLGPVDPQLGAYPAASLAKVVKTKDINAIRDKTLVLADMGEKALIQMRSELMDLFANKMPPDKAGALADKLSQGQWTHDHPIGLKEAKELGLPVTTNISKDIYQLMALFPQPTRRLPSVQYIPTPYGPAASPADRSDR